MSDKDMLLSTHVPGLDAILGGGLSHPSMVVIIGTPGAGKTILASQILFHAARRGLQTNVFTSFSEGIEQYVHHLRSLEFFDAALLGSAVQLFTHTPPVALAEPVADRTLARNGSAHIVLHGVGRKDVPAVIQAASQQGLKLYRVQPEEPSLEDVYFALQEL